MRLPTYRQIPLSTRISILFGGFKAQFGWAFFGFGMIFFWAFAMNMDLSFLYYNGNIVTVEGLATGYSGTNASENEVSVFANHFSFKTEDGVEISGTSYATGHRVLDGEALIVEYPEGKPQYARIKGMRTKIFSGFVIFVIIFPLIGLVFILLGLRRSFRALRLFKYGILTGGKLISKEKTNTRINNRIVYKMTFQYKDDLGREYERKEKTPLPYLLQDEQEERLLYLRGRPSYAILIDSLPSSYLMNKEGKIDSAPARNVFLLLIFPLSSIVGHGIYLLNTYFI